jgi:hypothetical protein
MTNTEEDLKISRLATTNFSPVGDHQQVYVATSAPHFAQAFV